VRWRAREKARWRARLKESERAREVARDG